jgi:uncharacterized membrane-anchored protein
MHAFDFIEEAHADEFMNRVESYWIKKPSFDQMHKRKVWNVCNTAGCYVMTFNWNSFDFGSVYGSHGAG